MVTSTGTPAVEVLADAWGRTTQTVTALPDADFALATRAAGWTVRDLLFHQMLDAQRALMTFASPSGSEPDVDAVTYWRAYAPGEDEHAADHAGFVRHAAAAYPRPAVLVAHWRDTAEAAVRAARAADPGGRVATQGHVLTVPDFVDTLVVEAAVHLLDLTLEAPGPAPSAAALASVRRVLTGLLGSPLPAGWDDTEAALKGTGRVPPTEQERAELGDVLPLFC